jgi:hypothetical protein
MTWSDRPRRRTLPLMNSHLTQVHAQANREDLGRAAAAEYRREKRMQRSGTGAGRLRVLSFRGVGSRSKPTPIPAHRV